MKLDILITVPHVNVIIIFLFYLSILKCLPNLKECNYKCLSCENSPENCVECGDENRENTNCACK